MDDQQLKKIQDEILRLAQRNDETEHKFDDYITGRIDGLEWCRRNI